MAALLLSLAIKRGDLIPLLRAKKRLLWTAVASVVTVFLTIGSVFLLFETYVHAGGHIPADGKSLPLGTVLPHGAVALVGYVNRLEVLSNCAWLIIAGRAFAPSNASGYGAESRASCDQRGVSFG
jgi:hypothetical protein